MTYDLKPREMLISSRQQHNPAAKIGGFAGAGISAAVEIGLMGGEQFFKAREKSKAEKKPERKKESIRWYDSTVKFKNSEFAGGNTPYIVIDIEPRHLRPDAEEKISIYTRTWDYSNPKIR